MGSHLPSHEGALLLPPCSVTSFYKCYLSQGQGRNRKKALKKTLLPQSHPYPKLFYEKTQGKKETPTRRTERHRATAKMAPSSLSVSFPAAVAPPRPGSSQRGLAGFRAFPDTLSALGAMVKFLTSGGAWGGKANPAGRLLAPVPVVMQPRHSRAAAGTGTRSWSAQEERLLSRWERGCGNTGHLQLHPQRGRREHGRTGAARTHVKPRSRARHPLLHPRQQ